MSSLRYAVRIETPDRHTAEVTLRFAPTGDTTDVMLDYVGYSLDGLREAYRGKVAAAALPAVEAEAMLAALEAGLTGYTYLHEVVHA